jgi:hypothetical protein
LSVPSSWLSGSPATAAARTDRTAPMTTARLRSPRCS